MNANLGKCDVDSESPTSAATGPAISDNVLGGLIGVLVRHRSQFCLIELLWEEFLRSRAGGVHKPTCERLIHRYFILSWPLDKSVHIEVPSQSFPGP